MLSCTYSDKYRRECLPFVVVFLCNRNLCKFIAVLACGGLVASCMVGVLDSGSSGLCF